MDNSMPYLVVGARSIPYPKAGIKLTPETYADFLRNTVHVQGRSAAQQDPHSMLSNHRQRVLGDTQPTRDRTRSRMPPPATRLPIKFPSSVAMLARTKSTPTDDGGLAQVAPR